MKGIYEREPGSGRWWIRYSDGVKIRREVAGSWSSAMALLAIRKAAVLEGRRLPNLRTVIPPPVVLFSQIADDYLAHALANNAGAKFDATRIARFKQAFGSEPADVAIAVLRRWFEAQAWKNSSWNRERTVLSLIFKLAVENKHLSANPADLLKRKKDPLGRTRFLDAKEETRLRAVILDRFPLHMPEFVIALATGMRSSEQYYRINWPCVDLLRRELYVPSSKNGEPRHIPLNIDAVAAFRELHRRTGGKGPIFAAQRGQKRYWERNTGSSQP